MKQMPDNSVDAIVTDPPYGISFMSKKWDYDIPSVELFTEMLRVLKPGGHILCACGTKTQHRMAVNIEDAGFEIRDIVVWGYGSGFPKGRNIGNDIDAINGHSGEVVEVKKSGSRKNGMANKNGLTNGMWNPDRKEFNIKKPSSEEGKEWEGWNTELKPSLEFFTMARKPISEKTIAENVMKWGTGAINIEACRVGTEGGVKITNFQDGLVHRNAYNGSLRAGDSTTIPKGRFPANFIHDGSYEIMSLFPETNGAGSKNGFKPKLRQKNTFKEQEYRKGWVSCEDTKETYSAARYFYCAKASPSERDLGLSDTEKGNFHPTVKPLSLMRYLCRLITPPEGVVLDPFCGSGTTAMAAKMEGFNYIAIEREAEYIEIIKKRIAAV